MTYSGAAQNSSLISDRCGVQGGRTDGQALDASPDTDRGSDYDDQMPDGMHEAIQDAVSGAVNDAVQEHLEVQPTCCRMLHATACI